MTSDDGVRKPDKREGVVLMTAGSGAATLTMHGVDAGIDSKVDEAITLQVAMDTKHQSLFPWR